MPFPARAFPNRRRLHGLLATLAVTVCGVFSAADSGPTPQPVEPAPAVTPAVPADERLLQLEQAVRDLKADVQALRAAAPADPAAPAQAAPERLHFGMYGEIHANFVEGRNTDKLDIHRFVVEIGAQFAEWIQFQSEVELEHAFVEDGNGEIVLEQCYFDFLFDPRLNLRAGRVLIPVGIINTRHTPTGFNGVERPFFDTVIVPTTWSGDGAGMFGALLPEVKYQAYIVGGLDGTGFSVLNGIRGGRIEERAGLNQAAFTARLDVFPTVRLAADVGQLRLGFSTFQGGTNNGNDGAVPGIRGSMALYAADFEYSYRLVDLRGAWAGTRIYRAGLLTGVASEIQGWMLELGLHVLPAGLKAGRLAHSDLIVFARYEDYDTQFRMPTGVARNPAGDRTAVTVGLTALIQANLGLKADYQWLDDATAAHLPQLMNFGLVWSY